MGHDLREMFNKEREKQNPVMKKGHEDRFLSRLEEEMPVQQAKKRVHTAFWLQMAASVAVLVSVGLYFLGSDNKQDVNEAGTKVVDSNVQEATTISLGDLSPDLKKIENYYLSNINLELSDLQVDPDNKEVMDNFMERLGELDAEYRRLNQELNQFGPNDQTINALIGNLQLRLQLLQKLKSKLNQLKSSKNEQKSSHIV